MIHTMTKLLVAGFGAAAWLGGIAIDPAGAETFSDDFTTSHNYLADGVTGTGWDGVLTTSTTVLNSNSTNAGKLTIRETSDWNRAGTVAAPFLYVNVTGDFVATTVIATATVGSYHYVGLLAVNPNDQTDYVGAHGRYTLLSSVYRHFTTSTTDGTKSDASVTTPNLSELGYYQIERAGNTFTTRYSKDNGTTWIDMASYTRDDLPDTLQVGVNSTCATTGKTYTAQFESFEVTQGVPKPLRLTGFSYDPADPDGASVVSLKGTPGARCKLVEASDLNFATPDRDPVPLTGAVVNPGTLDGDTVILDSNGEATVQFDLGTSKNATFIRAEETAGGGG